ncbi:MAG: hypothetical protein JXP34_15255 [Planctomycetes bacterium]|nr:hypothetical protein [Planctomycetota bacterium]
MEKTMKGCMLPIGMAAAALFAAPPAGAADAAAPAKARRVSRISLASPLGIAPGPFIVSPDGGCVYELAQDGTLRKRSTADGAIVAQIDVAEPGRRAEVDARAARGEVPRVRAALLAPPPAPAEEPAEETEASQAPRLIDQPGAIVRALLGFTYPRRRVFELARAEGGHVALGHVGHVLVIRDAGAALEVAATLPNLPIFPDRISIAAGLLVDPIGNVLDWRQDRYRFRLGPPEDAGDETTYAISADGRRAVSIRIIPAEGSGCASLAVAGYDLSGEAAANDADPIALPVLAPAFRRRIETASIFAAVLAVSPDVERAVVRSETDVVLVSLREDAQVRGALRSRFWPEEGAGPTDSQVAFDAGGGAHFAFDGGAVIGADLAGSGSALRRIAAPIAAPERLRPVPVASCGEGIPFETPRGPFFLDLATGRMRWGPLVAGRVDSAHIAASETVLIARIEGDEAAVRFDLREKTAERVALEIAPGVPFPWAREIVPAGESPDGRSSAFLWPEDPAGRHYFVFDRGKGRLAGVPPERLTVDAAGGAAWVGPRVLAIPIRAERYEAALGALGSSFTAMGFVLWDVEAGRASDLRFPCRVGCVSPDGKAIIAVTGVVREIVALQPVYAHHVDRYDPASGRLTGRVPLGVGSEPARVFASNGGERALVLLGTRSVVADLETGKIVADLGVQLIPRASHPLSRDGRSIVLEGMAGTIDLFRIDEGRVFSFEPPQPAADQAPGLLYASDRAIYLVGEGGLDILEVGD